MVVSINPFTSSPKTVTEITQLRIYPIKSCRGIQVDSTYLTKSGLDLDRRWMLALPDEGNKFQTIREVSEMTLIDTALVKSESGDDLLNISIRNTNNSVTIPARPTQDWLQQNASLKPCKIWSFDTDGWVYGAAINKMFEQIFGRPVVLIYKGPTPRIAQGNAAPGELGRESEVNFPDVMPLQIANEASIRELNRRLKARGNDEITIERFRPNIVVKGTDDATGKDAELPTAWSEDDWKTVRISNHEASGMSSYLSSSSSLDIDVQARCARCQVPNVHPETAYKNPKEPWDTLVSYRRVDEGIKWKPCFGMLSVPRNEGKIAVGMRFEVTATTNDHKYTKGF